MRSTILTVSLIVWLCRLATIDAFTCYSCANDFVIWHWSNFFSKRNYGLSSSEQACSSKRYASDFVQNCQTSCYSLNVTGTNRQTGRTAVVGYARGCSEAALTDSKSIEQLRELFGTKVPDIPFESDNIDFLEHWCFCEGSLCNQHMCYSRDMMAVQFIDSGVNFAPNIIIVVICSLILIIQAVR